MSKITRQKRKDNFTVVNNDILQNSKLSWAAKGMLVYLLHLPDGWQINVADLSNRSRNGRDGTAGIIKELMTEGYISRVKIKNEKSQFKGYDYTVTDEPENGKAVNGLSEHGSSENGKAVTNKDYPYEELNEVNTNEVKVVELHSTVTLIDEVDETSVEIHHIPEYFETEQKKPKEKSGAKKEKVDDPAPITPMWQEYEKRFADLNQGETPVFHKKYLRSLKTLFAVLRERTIKKGIVPINDVQPWCDFLDMAAQHLKNNPNETYLRGRFDPLGIEAEFNKWITTLNNRPKTEAEKWMDFARRNGVINQ